MATILVSVDDPKVPTSLLHVLLAVGLLEKGWVCGKGHVSTCKRRHAQIVCWNNEMELLPGCRLHLGTRRRLFRQAIKLDLEGNTF